MIEIDVHELPLELIDLEPQVRSDAAADDEGFDQSIREVGIQSPIRVYRRGAHYVVAAGERRFHAAKRTGAKTICAIIEESTPTDARRLQCQLVENIQRRELPAMDLARGLHDLMAAASCSAGEVAKRVGLSASAVSCALKLLTLPPEIQAKIGHEIPASAGYALSQLEDPEVVAKLADDVVAGRLTRDELAGRVKTLQRAKPSIRPPAKKIVAPLAAGRSISVRGDDLTLETVIAAIEELLAKLRKGRTSGLELATICRILRDTSKAS